MRYIMLCNIDHVPRRMRHSCVLRTDCLYGKGDLVQNRESFFPLLFP
jgi:hypothetical protein